MGWDGMGRIEMDEQATQQLWMPIYLLPVEYVIGRSPMSKRTVLPQPGKAGMQVAPHAQSTPAR